MTNYRGKMKQQTKTELRNRIDYLETYNRKLCNELDAKSKQSCQTLADMYKWQKRSMQLQDRIAELEQSEKNAIGLYIERQGELETQLFRSNIAVVACLITLAIIVVWG